MVCTASPPSVHAFGEYRRNAELFALINPTGSLALLGQSSYSLATTNDTTSYTAHRMRLRIWVSDGRIEDDRHRICTGAENVKDLEHAYELGCTHVY